MDPPQSLPPMTFQFRPVVPPPQQPQQFVSAPSHPFQPVGIGRGIPPPMNVAVLPPGPPQAPQPFFPQPMQQFPPRGSGQSIPLPVPHPPNGFTPPNIAGPALPLSSSYTFAPSSYGQIQSGFRDGTQYPSLSQVQTANIASNGPPLLPTENQIGVSVAPQQSAEQPSITNVIAPPAAANIQPNLAAEALPDWREHTSADGRKYYYNRRTRLSSWEKPIELMTPTERADASTNWKEFTSPDGKKYYYNKATKESKWVIPEELKLAREQAIKAPLNETPPSTLATTSSAPDSGSSPIVESSAAPTADTSFKPEGSMLDESSKPEVPTSSPSPVSVEAVGGGSEQQQAQLVSRSSSSPVVASTTETNGDGDQNRSASVLSISDTSAFIEPKNDSTNVAHDIINSDGGSTHYKEESSKDVVGEKTEDVAQAPEDKSVDREPLVYVNKLEAKNAFMALLESTNVGSDWTWDRAMRVIITDKRYGALKTLGERKQAFNEYLVQKKKQDAEERRARQKRAREDFKRMLEESSEVTSSVRWSKVESFFENDERFKAVERDRDRRDIFETHVEELKKEEQAKAQEEHRYNRLEYRKYLESCDFIKANSQWRRVQDRLEADERCSRLEKIVRLEIFQEYINDLEREEEEQRKIQKEELRKVERRNRDEFRKLMDEHISEGTLTAKTLWRDYCMMVKDLPAYLAVVSNASGSTPKDLFDDVVEELQKQYDDDRTRVKDAIKLGKINVTSDWTFNDFNNSIMNDTGSSQVSDINLKLVFDELLERIKEKEEKEAKRLKRLKDDFSHLISSIKEISAATDWEDCKIILRHRHEYRSIGDESLCQEIFENYVTQIKEQAKEREQKRKDDKARKEKERDESERNKAKQRKEKESGRSREKDEHLEKDGAENETTDSKDGKRSGRNGSRRHRKRNRSSDNYADENDHSKKSHESSSGHKKSRSVSATESDHESRHRRHRRDHHHGGSRRNDDHMELEDGELGTATEDR